MRFVKKLMAFILAFSFVLPIGCVNIYAADADYEETNENVEILLAFGLYESKKSGDFDDEQYMSRLEFAGVLAKMFKLEEYTDEQIFTDVSLGTQNAGYIGAAYKSGIFSGDGSGLFRPYDTVTCFEAVKSILYAAGHGELIDMTDGNIWKYAQEQKLTKGLACAYGDKMTMGGMAKLLVNAFDLKVVYTGTYYKNIGKATVSLGKTTDNETTVLTEIMKMQKVKGIVTADEFTSVSNGLSSPCKENQVELNGIVYDAEGYSDLLGMYVNAYVTNEEDAVYNSIVYASPNERTDVLTIKYSDFTFADGKISYENGIKTKTARLDSAASVIYNKNFVGNLGTSYVTPDNFDIKSGKLTLIDNDGDNIYDVCCLEEYETAYIVDVVHEEGIYVDGYSQTRINLDDDGCKYEFYYNGDQTVIEKISKNSVLSIMKSPNGALCRVYISDESVNGTITAIRSEDDGEYVEIDGKKYRLSNYWINLRDAGNRIAESIDFNSVGKFLLDYDGEIAAFINVKNEYYGYIVEVRRGDDDTAWIKMYTENGRFEKYNVAEKCYITERGTTTKCTPVAAAALLQNYTLIQYSLNDSREVKDIFFADYNKNGTNSEFTYSVKKAKLTCYDKVLGAMYSVGSSTKLFNVPDPTKCPADEVNDERSYGMDDNFSTSSDYVVDVYCVDEYRTAGVVVNYRESGGDSIPSGYTSPMIVEEVTHVMYDDEICVKIDGYVNGTRKTIYCSDLDLEPNKSKSKYSDWYIAGFKPENLRRGDVIIYSTKGGGYLNEYVVLLRAKVQEQTPAENWTETGAVPADKQRADIYAAYGKVIAVNNEQVVYSLPGGGEKVMRFPSWGYTYLVDLEEKTIETSSKDNVHTGDMVFLFANWGNLYNMVIYRTK